MHTYINIQVFRLNHAREKIPIEKERGREAERDAHILYIKHTGIETKTYKRVDTERERDMIICQKEQAKRHWHGKR